METASKKTKVLYALPKEQDQKEIREVAEDAGVELEVCLFSRESDQETMKRLVAAWEQKNPDIILTRGSWEKRIRALADHTYVMGIQFAFDSVIENLCGYRRKHPEFFEDGPKRVLMVSLRPLPLNQEVLQDLFDVTVDNMLYEATEDKLPYKDRVTQYDLVIAGVSWIPYFEKWGVNYYNQEKTEVHSLKNSLVQADMLVKSRRQLQEKNREIRNLLDNSFHAVVAVDEDGIIFQCNAQLKRYFQKEVSDMMGLCIYDFIPKLKPEMIRSVIATQKGFYGELAECGNRVLVMNSFPLYADGEVNGVAIYLEELKQIERVEEKIRSEYYSKGLVAKYCFDDIIGRSEQMRQAKVYAGEFAGHSSNILLYGESGTGKELFAQSIHNASPRKNGPFVAMNCGALPGNLLESELFGYVGGAFTGASKNGKKGFLELANKGTIFLDEISELEPMGQVRFLRVLEERVVTRIGDDKVIPVDIRIIAASNKNLKKLVEEGKFREDLYYRLNVLMLKIPALRERVGDVGLLTDHFLEHFGQLNRKQIELDPGARQMMERYSWPGNVRQLRNFCERMVIIANTRVIGAEFVKRQLEDSYFEVLDFPEKSESDGMNPAGAAQTGGAGMDPAGTVSDAPSDEKERVLWALNRTGGRREEAAALLGLSKTSLWRRMKQYGISEKY